MNRHDLVISVVSSNDGAIEGRTVIQKLAYFANLRLGIDGITYKDYFYGPFSREVALALENLASSLFVRETVHPIPIEHYTYELTDDGKDLAAIVMKESPAEHNIVKSIVVVCKEHCELQARPMSCAAKVHFIRNNESIHAESPQEIRELAKDFGWNMNDHEIERGMTLLNKIAPSGAVT